LPVLPQHIFGQIPPANLRLSNYNLQPVGAGPYISKGFSKRNDGFITDYRLTANKNYGGGEPYIKDFYFKFYQTPDDLTAALTNRDIDGFGTLSPIDTTTLQSSSRIVETVPMARYYSIFFNSNANPNLKNASLRKALVEAVDRGKIIESVFGRASPAKVIDSPVFAGLIMNDASSTLAATSTPLYNPQDARSILSSLKLPGGGDATTLSLTLIVPRIDFLMKTADIIKNEWMDAGVGRVNIVTLDESEVVGSVIKNRDYELLLFGNVLQEPADLFPFWHSSQQFYPGLNFALYNNSKVDRDVETVRQSNDPAAVSASLKDADANIEKDLPALFLYSLPYAYVHSADLGGFETNQVQNLSRPSDRFNNVTGWYVSRARVVK
jgi:ABC-type transport system substrate-binding protein